MGLFTPEEIEATIPVRKYRVHSMTEIKKIKKRFTVVSTFSGGGGSSLGYCMAGGKVLLANEFVESARDTYKANFPDTKIILDDIRTISGKDILKQINLKKGELDIFDGSPPCSSFSMMGKREKGWGKEKKYSDKIQKTDDLFFEFIRVAKDLQAKVIIAENVPGLLAGNAKKYLAEIVKGFESIGYNCQYKVLNAANYGVPQNRKRVIFICVRNDIKIKQTFPLGFDYKVSTRDAIHDLLSSDEQGVEDNWWKQYLTKMPARATKKQIAEIVGRKQTSFLVSRLATGKWTLPSNTILQSHTSVAIHPLLQRGFSISEAKRLQSFPDDFILNGPKEEQWERIGRSVPPLLMKAVASHVYKTIISNV